MWVHCGESKCVYVWEINRGIEEERQMESCPTCADLTLLSSSVSTSLVRWSTASSISESDSKPERENISQYTNQILTQTDTELINVRVCCISPVCCDSEVSAEVAVICRLALLSDRAENTMLHRDGWKAESTLSSNMEGLETKTQKETDHF